MKNNENNKLKKISQKMIPCSQLFSKISSNTPGERSYVNIREYMITTYNGV
jgi:hypothetical protein